MTDRDRGNNKGGSDSRNRRPSGPSAFSMRDPMFGFNDTGVICPDCNKSPLLVRFSCLFTTFVCEQCSTGYALDQLASKIDDEQFAILEKVVADRLSDRI